MGFLTDRFLSKVRVTKKLTKGTGDLRWVDFYFGFKGKEELRRKNAGSVVWCARIIRNAEKMGHCKCRKQNMVVVG